MRWFTIIFAACLVHRAEALEFETITHAGKSYTLCRVDLRKDQLHLFLRDDHGQFLKSFAGIDSWLAPRGQRLLFGMNAGMFMFQPPLAPVGWFVENGQQIAPLTTANGYGNFFLKPNGVFLVNGQGAHVLETSLAAALSKGVQLATQSGPLLVEKGKIHPAFIPGSTSSLFRNGVGVSSPQDVVFAISEGPVNFYEFATLFRDTLHCPDALFFDGTVSSLHAPALHRSDRKIDLGPIIGIVGPLSTPQP